MAELNRSPTTVSLAGADDGALLITMGGEYGIRGIENIGPESEPESEAVLDRQARSVIVEMGTVEFMGTSGIALLLRIANRFGALGVRNAGPIVGRAIEALGLAGRRRLVRG